MKHKAKSAILMGAAGLVLAATSANAQPDVKVDFYGLLDVFAGTSKPGNSDDRKYMVDSGGMTTSYLGMKATVDAGYGLTGIASVEMFYRPDTGADGRYDGDTFFARSAYLGLASKDYGMVKLGRNTNPYFLSTVLFNSFGDSFVFSPAVLHSFTGGLLGDSGWSNSIVYSTPKIGGFSATVAYAAGERGSESHANKVGGNVFYTAGKFAATVAVQHVDRRAHETGAATPDDDQDALLVGASYDFGVAKLFGQYQMMNDEYAAGGKLDRDTYVVGVSVPVGKGAILASYGRTERDGAVDSERDTFAVGYTHQMTKALDLYVGYVYDKDDLYADDSADTFGVGGRFRF